MAMVSPNRARNAASHAISTRSVRRRVPMAVSAGRGVWSAICIGSIGVPFDAGRQLQVQRTLCTEQIGFEQIGDGLDGDIGALDLLRTGRGELGQLCQNR